MYPFSDSIKLHVNKQKNTGLLKAVLRWAVEAKSGRIKPIMCNMTLPKVDSILG